ncbi:MAG TPA: leucine-rich repeat protein, partial [Clostridiales bacterium]|nr:leucine-rich repeat protein [Clostridiales bacterium]
AYFMGDAPVTAGTDIFYHCTDGFKVYYLNGASGFTNPWHGYETVCIDFAFSVSDGQAAVTGYTGTGTDIVIPGSLAGCPVTAVGGGAFRDNTALRRVVIPDSVLTVGNSAFRGCTGLTDVAIGENVERIDNYAFHGCTGLTEAAIPDCVTTIGYSAFGYCSNLENVTMGDHVQTIGTNAFESCGSLSALSLPDSVTSIGAGAFSYCSNLAGLNLGNGITAIGTSVFKGCSSLTAVDIPDSVQTVGNWAFAWCGAMTSLTFGSALTAVGDYAFYGCNGLGELTFPEGMQTVGSNAFNACTALNSAFIPATVTSIGTDAFLGCDGLVITGMAGSYAQTYAAANGIAFNALYLKAKTGSTCVIDEQNRLIYGLAPGIASLDDFVSAAQGYQLECQPGPSGFGTGSLALVKQGGAVMRTYTVLIYGDVNGDGNIDSGDAGLIVDAENFMLTINQVTGLAV